jgi:hypothetical protein
MKPLINHFKQNPVKKITLFNRSTHNTADATHNNLEGKTAIKISIK